MFQDPETEPIPAAEPGPRSVFSRAVIAAAVLLAGVLCWAGSRVMSASQHHSYSAGSAPAAVEVISGTQYRISVREGAAGLQRDGQQLKSAQCEWSSTTSPPQQLEVTPEQSDTKATHVVASFTAPATGQISVACAGWGELFIDDAASASGDRAGFLLLLAVVLLTVGVGLSLSVSRLSVARSASMAGGSSASGSMPDSAPTPLGPVRRQPPT